MMVNCLLKLLYTSALLLEIFGYFTLVNSSPVGKGFNDWASFEDKFMLRDKRLPEAGSDKYKHIADFEGNNLEEIGDPKRKWNAHHKKSVSKRRHISKVPLPPYPLFNMPLRGLADDQKHSHSNELDESLLAQKRAFEAMLNEHQKHPKLPKDINQDSYIILKYDSENRKYTITEESDE